MNVAINIRGTGGSGKSYLIHKLLKDYKHKRIIRKGEGRKKPRIIAYYISEFNLYVIGRYDLQCGGIDTIQGNQLIRETLERYAKKGHILYEGYLISSIWSTYRELSDRHGNTLWLIMDTPLEVCLDRVIKRRISRGNLKPLDPFHITSVYKMTLRHIVRCREANNRYEMLNHKKPYKQLISIIKRETNAD